MRTISGIYKNGSITLENDYTSDQPIKVMVTFLDDTNPNAKGISFKDFSFSKSQQNLESLHSNLSDTVIEERRNDS